MSHHAAVRIPSDLIIAFGLLVAMIAASLAFNRQQATDLGILARVMAVQRNLGEVLTAARDGESSQRGYLLTADPVYLAPFEEAEGRARASLQRLAAIDDLHSHIAAARLRPLVDAKFLELRATLRLSVEGRRAVAIELVRNGAGRRVMAQLRSEALTTRDQLRTVIGALQDRERRTAAWLTAGLLAGLVAIGVLALIGLRLHRRQIVALREARDAAELSYREHLAASEGRAQAESQLRQLQKMESVGQLTGGIVTSVTDAELMDAKAVIDRAGIGCEPASAASLAGIRQLVARGEIAEDATVVGVVTGNVLKDSDAVIQYHLHDDEHGARNAHANRPIRVAAEIDALKRVLDAVHD